MKHLKYSGFLIALGIFAVSAYAFDSALEQAPTTKTLADFQKEYSGTKSVVAWMKYHDYLALQKMPRPTLESSSMRVEPAPPFKGISGTKDIVKFTRSRNWNSEGLEKYVDKSRPFLNPDPAPGTKAVVAFTRSRR